MQIISGKFKGARLKSPNDEKTHPMGSREKLALFNMLTGKIEGKIILDAFAGTGALGLESLSRGAKSVVFLEKSPKIAKILQENVKNVLKTEQTEETKIFITGVEEFQTNNKFDLIFADPPYDFYSEALIRPLVQFLDENGVLCLSFPKTAKTPELEGLSLITRRDYAAASIALFQKNK